MTRSLAPSSPTGQPIVALCAVLLAYGLSIPRDSECNYGGGPARGLSATDVGPSPDGVMEDASAVHGILASVDTDRRRNSPADALANKTGFAQTGFASWYGLQFQHKRTANGERFDMNGLSAAHRNLPLNCHVRVTNLENDRSVVVRVNDRGPFIAGRIIDVSAEAARRLGFKEKGVARVRVEVVKDSEA